MKRTTWSALLVMAATSVAFGCKGGGGEGGRIQSAIGYDEGAGKLLVVTERNLRKKEDLHVRVRSLADGDTLDCGSMAKDIATFDEKRDKGLYVGPAVNASQFENPTNPNTLLGETEASYQERLANTWFVDICVMKGDEVRHQARYDLRQALDRRGGDGKGDEFDDGEKIVSNQAYAAACIKDMGDIPFWGESIGEDGQMDWNTIDCTEIGTPIPTTIDGVPTSEHRPPKCDNPQTIYSHCEADARTSTPENPVNGPRVASARNAQGTHWVLLCRKTLREEGRFEDMAMIGHNPFTGQTCFIQNQLPFGETPKPANDGKNIPHPADNVSSEASPQMWSDMWGGIEGGIGPSGGIQCQGCHSTDPFIHTPWIDGAVDEFGDPVVPKIGRNPDFVEGYAGPYRLLDAADQGWKAPKVLVSEEASSCTSCHRIGLDQWTAPSSITARNNEDGGCVFCGQAPWLNRLEGLETGWDNLLTEGNKAFKNVFWMPPNAADVLNAELWGDSDYKKAIDFIKMCGAEPTNPACIWEALPEEPGNPEELPIVEETGTDLAQEALAVLGAPYVSPDGTEHEKSRRCAECHAISRNGLRDWLDATLTAAEAGIDSRQSLDAMTQPEAKALVDFMRKGDENSVFAAAKIGVNAPGVQFPYFQKLFQKAYEGAWGIEYGKFLTRVSMPKGSHAPLSAREFAVLQKWFIDERLANLDELLPEIPPPATCAEVVAEYGLDRPAPWLQTHINNMEFDGWGARNTEAGINMYGCTDSDPLNCFSDVKFKQELGWAAADIPNLNVLMVRDLGFDTSFWMRTSADGRFVGNGGRGGENFSATITDLITSVNIGVSGSYDPGFFPNNQGFIMQGGGAGLCGQSVLTNPEAIMGGIDFTEPGCSKAEGINLYQHVAVNLDGGDYFVINGQFTSDSGSASNTDPRAPFAEGAEMKFSPLVFDGSDWSQKPAVTVASPYEGDSVLSPSGQMVISRFAGPDGVALGAMVRRVQATPSGDSYNINIDLPLQFLCGGGAKQNISFDERYAVTHRYENDTANLYVSDLLTGAITKVTNMPAGTKALFPHFRSDGWIYFLTTGGEGDRAMATDAALLLAAAN